MSEGSSSLTVHLETARVGFFIHVTAGAKHERLGPLHGDALRVAIHARAVEGRANAACVESIARALDVARSDVEIDPGARSRRKRVWVTGDPEQIGMQLRVLAGEE